MTLSRRHVLRTAADTVTWYEEEKGADCRFGARAGLTSEREAELLGKWKEAGSGDEGAAGGR